MYYGIILFKSVVTIDPVTLISLYRLSGILVEATGDVTVQGGSTNDMSSDAFLVLPRAALGYEYYVMSYQYEYQPTKDAKNKQELVQGPSQFGVVGTRNETRVTIRLPDGHPGIDFSKGENKLEMQTRIRVQGRTLRLTMTAYETLQVRRHCNHNLSRKSKTKYV